MKVLLSGGNDILRRSIAGALVGSAHDVRVLLPHSSSSAHGWPANVEPWPVAVGDTGRLSDAARDRDAAIVLEPLSTASTHSSDPTLDTSQVFAAVGRAGPRRVIHVTSGVSRVPQALEWLSVRTSPVYGVGDDAISIFLIMMRSLPAMPILGDQHVMRPLWHGDLASALAQSLSLGPNDVNRTVEISGPDAINQTELYEHIAGLIDRRPLRLPIPDFIAAHGGKLAEALRLPVPFESIHLPFATAGNIGRNASNALSTVFGLTGTRLDDGLRRLILELSEVTPAEGVGTLEVKRFSTIIRGSAYDATELLRRLRMNFKDVMPIEVGVEPAAPQTELIAGGVVTIALPGRGHVQIRVEEVTDQHVVVATLRGHAVAGIVRFATESMEGGVRFEVMTCDAAANAFDWVTLTLGGARIQDANWTRVVHNVVELSGGVDGGVESDARTLSDTEATNVEQWIRSIIGRQRAA